MESRTKARRGLAIFLVVLIAGSAYIEYPVARMGGNIGLHLGWIYALMWWVTVSSVVARLVMRESPRDVSLRWGGWAGTRAMLVATALPRVVGLLAYGSAGARGWRSSSRRMCRTESWAWPSSGLRWCAV